MNIDWRIKNQDELFLPSALEISNLGFWQWNIQDGSEIWSHGQFRIFGYEPEEVKSSHNLFVESVHPDDRGRVLKAIEHALAEVEPFKTKFRIVRPDKTERIVMAQGEIFRDEESIPLTMVGTIFDITDYAIVKADLQKSNERFRAFMRTSTEAMYCVELHQPLDINLAEDEQFCHLYKYGYISEANDVWAKDIAGFEHADDLMGSSLEEIIPSKYPENITFIRELIRSSYRLHNYETVEEYKTGVKIYATNTVVGIIENGQLVRVWGTGRDITKQRHLEKELQRNEKDLQKLAGQLIAHQENECSRIARELHDDLTQQLAVIAIEAGNIERQFKDMPETVLQKISHIHNLLIKVSEDMHNLSRGLHPSILYDLGLERAVQSECNNFLSRTGLAVVFDPKNVPDNIPIDISLSVYRVIQECLLNIANHAKTKTAYVFLEGSSDKINLAVRDTGDGFDPEKVRKKSGLGLRSMRERVRIVNGELSITSKPGKGTNVEVKIPFKMEK